MLALPGLLPFCTGFTRTLQQALFKRALNPLTMTDISAASSPAVSAQSATLRIALIQFLFMVSWVLYGIYFGDLLLEAGIDKSWLVPIFLFDQLVFALMDPIMGAWADRIERMARRLVPLVIGLNALSALAFVALPLVGMHSPTLLLAATLVWVASASVLRAPLFVILDRLPGAPDQTTRVAQAAAGIAIGAAIAPFIGMGLKGISPLVPFLLSTLVLLIAGFSLSSLPARAGGTVQQTSTAMKRPISWLFVMTLLLACGFQFHAFVGSAALYKRFVAPDMLGWVLPVFWVGFNLMLLPAPRWIHRHGAGPVLSWMAMIGSVALLVCLVAPNLPLLLVGQCVLGACWGGCFVAGMRSVQGWPTQLGNGLAMGGWFCMLSLAAAWRISLDKILKVDAMLLEQAAVLLWVLAALVAWRLFSQREKS